MSKINKGLMTSSQGGRMTEGEKAGCWALAYLYIALFGAWFTVACIAWYHIKEWFV